MGKNYYQFLIKQAVIHKIKKRLAQNSEMPKRKYHAFYCANAF